MAKQKIIIELDQKDILKLIAEKFNINPNGAKINIEKIKGHQLDAERTKLTVEAERYDCPNNHAPEMVEIPEFLELDEINEDFIAYIACLGLGQDKRDAVLRMYTITYWLLKNKFKNEFKPSIVERNRLTHEVIKKIDSHLSITEKVKLKLASGIVEIFINDND